MRTFPLFTQRTGSHQTSAHPHTVGIKTCNTQVKNSHKAEVTTVLKGTVIRSSQETPDMYASIDLVADRVVSAYISFHLHEILQAFSLHTLHHNAHDCSNVS
mmetsp:Transcript_65958/g.97680  ORF Transcript_65958/g.97680 Transcript_65958/m.97680 type:complete len:102 (-) Transcript_65958:148-453(-)